MSAAARARVYAWLSRLFAQPTGGPGPRRLALSVARAGGTSAAAAAAKAVEQFYPDSAAGCDEMLIEWTRLFYGPGQVPVPLYESIYRDGGVLLGPTTLAVAESYRSTGLELDPAVRELPDHLALELGFLHYLSLREARAGRKGDQNQAAHWASWRRQFAERHLERWAPLFLERLAQANPHPLYAAAGELLRAVLQPPVPVH